MRHPRRGRLWERVTWGGRRRRSATQPLFHSSASWFFHSTRRKITRQGIEEIIVLILEDVFLAGHQRLRGPAPWHGRPIFALAVSSGDKIAPAFCSSVPIRCVLLWDKANRYSSSSSRLYSAQPRQKFLPQRAAPFLGVSYMTQRIKAFIQQRRDLCAPFFSKFRQSVLTAPQISECPAHHDLFELCHR